MVDRDPAEIDRVGEREARFERAKDPGVEKQPHDEPPGEYGDVERVELPRG